MNIDWDDLINRGTESKDLDYKGLCVWDEKNDKKACCDIVKDVLAMANTEGGWIVIGVEEPASGKFVPTGLTAQQAEAYETSRFNRFLRSYAEPPVNTLMYKKEDAGRTFVAIQVPLFASVPHICKKAYPDVLTAPTFYVRTASNESAPVSNAAELNAMIEHSVSNRSDQLLAAFRTILTRGLQPIESSDENKWIEQAATIAQRSNDLDTRYAAHSGFRETTFHPSQFETQRFDMQQLGEMARRGSGKLRGWPFIFMGDNRFTHNLNDGIETAISEPTLGSHGISLHYWQLKQSGLLFTRQGLADVPPPGAPSGRHYMGFVDLAFTAAEAIHCLVRMYEGVFDDSENITLNFNLRGINEWGLHVGAMANAMLGESVVYHDDDITYHAVRPLVDWKAGIVDHAVEICDYVFTRFNWNPPNLDECRRLITELLSGKMPQVRIM